MRPLITADVESHTGYAHPLCKFCLSRGIVTAATVVDHVIPHRGNWNAFVTGELLTLCAPCHNGAKQQIEQRGYFNDIGNRRLFDRSEPSVQPNALGGRRSWHRPASEAHQAAGILRARLGSCCPSRSPAGNHDMLVIAA